MGNEVQNSVLKDFNSIKAKLTLPKIKHPIKYDTNGLVF